MTSESEKSFKAKIRAIAQEKKRDPSDIWQNLTIERFLMRLVSFTLQMMRAFYGCWK